MTSIIAIVGRPNVGKSTLFNRLSRSKGALVDNRPGVTRDRLYASITWEGKAFIGIDTGGYDEPNDEPLLDLVRRQVTHAIEEADRIIFMVDGRQGIMPGDEDMADILRRSRKEIFLAVNKVDGPEHDSLTADFYKLGLGNIHPFSAAHGYGLKSLMGEVLKNLPSGDFPEEDKDDIRVAIVGRPNVGKSSLINRVLGSDRLLVSELPGTTRDSVDTHFTWQDKAYVLIDTAGLRRKARVKEKIDKFSMIKAIRSLDRCHVAVIVMDASDGIVDQDARICGYALERGRGIILAFNKWDLVKNNPGLKKRLDNEAERHLRFMSFAPRLNLSALTGERVRKLFEKIGLLYGQYSHRVGTGSVNKAIDQMVKIKPPTQTGKGRLKFYYATQTGIKPPTFVVFVNKPEMVHFSYRRFMVNQFREHFGLNHTPIKIVFRKKE